MFKVIHQAIYQNLLKYKIYLEYLYYYHLLYINGFQNQKLNSFTLIFDYYFQKKDQLIFYHHQKF